MKVNSSELSISLVLNALETAVEPEAQSEGAKNAIANIRLTLLDLLKRQGPGKILLQKCIESGVALCHRIQEVLGVTTPTLSIWNSSSPPQDYDTLANIYDVVTEQIDQLLAQLLTKLPKHRQTRSFLRQAAEWEQIFYSGLQTLAANPFAKELGGAPPSKSVLSADYLQEILRSKRQNPSLEVSHFVTVPGGFGNQTFFCTLKTMERSEEVVVRKADGLPIVLPLEQEYDLVCTLHKTGLPVAKPLELVSPIPGMDGAFFAMARLPGRMASSYVDGTKTRFDERLLLKLAELLGKIHSIPVETFTDYLHKYKDEPALYETVEERHHRKLEQWERYSREAQHPASPFVKWLLNWLKENVPADNRRLVLAHGDYNVHNVLADGNEVTGILDWECADFGAPEMDLAYIQRTVSAHMDWNVFLEHYYKYGGLKIDPANLVFCSAYSALRLALAAGRFSSRLQSGVNRDIKFINVEQNLTAAIMMMGLAVTKAAEDEARRLEEAEECHVPAKGDEVRTEAVHVEFA